MGGVILEYESKKILNEGLAKGQTEGDFIRLAKTVQKMQSKGMSLEEIADLLDEPLDTIEKASKHNLN